MKEKKIDFFYGLAVCYGYLGKKEIVSLRDYAGLRISFRAGDEA
jgi:hypothetical protein